MKVAEIEALPEVKRAATVLRELELYGLIEPAIASGWIRAKLTDSYSPDIDVAYVGCVHYQEAQEHLREVLSKLGCDPEPWDIKGIWNAQMAYGIDNAAEHYLLYYVDSIDTVYLASDGKLHDPTGFGFKDAETKTLRINDYDRRNGAPKTPKEEVNICVEGCRRIAQLSWTPTEDSAQRIKDGVTMWNALSANDKLYFVQKLAKKYKANERPKAKSIYEQFGWGFIFDL